MLAAACIRIGNFFNSEIIGLPSNVPWAVIFAKYDGIPRHPSQIYEAFGYAWIALVFYVLFLRNHRKIPEGRWFGLIMIVSWSFRSVMEQFKENQVSFEQGMALNMGQLLSIPFLIVGLGCAFLIPHRIPFLRKFIEKPVF
jgi:prolipoprotein diacylglyceryltransferase